MKHAQHAAARAAGEVAAGEVATQLSGPGWFRLDRRQCSAPWRGRGLWRALPLMLVALASPAAAQMAIQDLNDLPGQRTLTPMNRLLPTDPHVVIRAFLRDRLPSMWWGREFSYSPGRIAAEVHIPTGWQGNPTSAMMNLCPPPNDNLWRIFREIELKPYYDKKLWPSYTCRG